MKERWQDASRTLGRGSLLGTALHLSLTAHPHVNLQMNLLACVVAVIWCSIDGITARGTWWFPFVEGLAAHFSGVFVGIL